MSRARPTVLVLLVLAVLCWAAPPAAADDGNYRFNLYAGMGGSLDDDDAGVSNSTYQLGFAFLPEEQLHVGLRVGQLDLGNALIGNLVDNSIDYATVVGEYRFTESFYESGMFIGLGAYQLDGTVFSGGTFSESSIGLVLGISGEFLLTDRLSFLVELSGHLTNLDTVDSLAMGHAGLSLHF